MPQGVVQSTSETSRANIAFLTYIQSLRTYELDRVWEIGKAVSRLSLRRRTMYAHADSAKSFDNETRVTFQSAQAS